MLNAISSRLIRLKDFPRVGVLLRPGVSLALGLCLTVMITGAIFYVQKTLSEIESALPIRLSAEERDIRVLVNEMGRLDLYVKLSLDSRTEDSFELVKQQVTLIERYLGQVREQYRFKDILGITAMHARLNPAIFDIKNWLSAGLYDFQPDSIYTMQMVEQRATGAREQAELLLREVEVTSHNVLSTQAGRIKSFRDMLVLALVILTIMTVGLVVLGYWLQRMLIALKQSEAENSYRANYDDLTGLPNRSNFIERLDEAIKRSQRVTDKIALLFIDLDRFKTINDTLGHDYGDELIKQVALRIQGSSRETDVVSRLGGDEFTLLLTNMDDEFQASVIAQHILNQLSTRFVINGHEIYSSASIGITIFPGDGNDIGTLLKNADMAMYEAKDQGKNTFRFFTPEMTERTKTFLEIDKGMRRALVNGEFRVYFQPILELGNLAPVGLEALVRWQHPDRGLLESDEFIPIAEETGLIDDIGLWVLRQACKEVLSGKANVFAPDLYLSVNISMRQFKGGFDTRQVTGILEETGFPANRLMLEITESVLMDEDKRIKDVLTEFKHLGIRLALDDFGTGYSALSYLREFPVNTLKIDRSFIGEISENKNDQRLVAAIVKMAQSLGINTVAEGVESVEQESLLADLNCQMVQGFYYCEPQRSCKAALEIAVLKSRS